MKRLTLRPMFLATTLALLAPSTAWAGPPFMTDDPEPTETGHWEIYGPLVEGEGRGANFEGSVGAEFNYGVAPDMQLTIGVPIAYAHDSSGARSGAGDVAVSLKYRFYNNEELGLSVAVFPGLTLPTARAGLGGEKVTGLLPIWFQKDSGAWSVFGGGGYAFNPGAGNRDYATGGIAVSRQITRDLLLGVEVDRQGADTVGGEASTSFGLGAIYRLKAPYRLLASFGPTYEDGVGEAKFHAFIALGLDF